MEGMNRKDIPRPDLGDICAYWKPWIGLDNFTTAIRYCSHGDMTEMVNAGETDMATCHMKMWIRILDPLEAEEKHLENLHVEETVVHELIHSLIDQFYLIDWIQDRAGHIFAEQSINTLSRALVDQKNALKVRLHVERVEWQSRNRHKESERVGRPEIKGMLAYWQSRLDLRDYTIQAHYRSKQWMIDEGQGVEASGCAEITSNHKKMEIGILEPSDIPEKDLDFMGHDGDPEITLVHEMVHALIWRFFRHEGKAQDTAVENIVETMAQALVGLKRLSEGWTPNGK